MPQLAQRVGRAKPSAIMVIAEKAKQLKAAGRDIISFSIGVPNFLPGDHVYEAAREALKHDSGQYGSNRGAEPLLDAFLKHIEALGFSGYGRMNLSIGIGAKQVLYNLAEAMLDEGDEICFAAPYWTTYHDIADIVGAKANVLHCGPEQNYKLTPAQLEAALKRKPKVFLFNNPSNPTGMVYTREEISALAAVLVRYPDTWIVTDDIYNSMVFDGIGYHNFVFAEPALRERLVFVDSVSKTYGMPGWRVGLIAGPESVAKAVTTLNSNHITSVPEVITAAAVAAFGGPQDVPRAKCEEFAGKRDVVYAALRRSRAWCARVRRARSMRSRISRWRSARATTARRFPTTWSSARPCWKPPAWPACPAPPSASRVRCAFPTPVPRCSCSRASNASRPFSRS